MTAYYNEFDPFAAAWLKALIDKGLIARGDVDSRSIRDVRPDDLRGYSQCHFFAGIGGWSVAFRLAGLADDFPAWSGSCPCQPFSQAGQRKGFADPRHLWPEFFRLISERRPSIVFGEQVASSDGRLWLAGVRSDLESLGYAVGAADLCAAGVGAPHIRQRLYWLADADLPVENERASSGQQSLRYQVRQTFEGVGDATSEQKRATRFAWEQSEAIECEDGWRRVESGARPLENGIPYRLDRIRGFGNAIVPQVAAEFIAAALECAP